MTEVVVTHPEPPVTPLGLTDMGGSWSATVLVIVNPDGSVKSTSVEISSGYLPVDKAALKAARLSTYSPKTVDCKSVEGEYRFTATFEPN